MYPLSQFDGKMKTVDWSRIRPSRPPGHNEWVNPETYLEDLPAVMKEVPPLPGEEALYGQLPPCLRPPRRTRQPRRHWWNPSWPPTRNSSRRSLQWRYNGIPAGNGWTTLTNGAQWGTDYVNRTAVAVSNIYVNVPPEAKYFYNDNDSAGMQLDGQ